MNPKDFQWAWWARRLFVSDKPYFMKRKEEKGIKDLERLAETKDQEGVWVYVHRNNFWVSVGYSHIFKKEGNQRVTGQFTHDFNYSMMGDKVTHYHFHPKSTEDYYVQDFMSKATGFSDEVLKGTEEIARKMGRYQNVLPSPDDIDSYAYLTELCTGEIDYKIVSTHGILTTDIDYTEELGEAYSKLYYELLNDNDFFFEHSDPVEAAIQRFNSELPLEMSFKSR